MKFGVYLPAFAWENLTYEQARAVKDYAQRAESLGYDSLWVADRLLAAPERYGVARLSPLAVLAHVAGCTERINLGTAILNLPLRNPVLLAKEIATLDYLSGGRFILGVGPGRDEKEFALCGMRLNEKGRRTDEGLEIIRRLLTETSVSYAGKYYRFEGVSIEPLPRRLPPIWVGGGSKPERPFIAASVLRRISRADGWVARAAGPPEMIRNDWQAISAYLKSVGRDQAEITFSHVNFLHLVDTSDREEALRVQAPLFQRAMGPHRSLEELQQCYLMGTAEQIGARIESLRQMGISYLLLSPLTNDPSQLDFWARTLFPRFR